MNAEVDPSLTQGRLCIVLAAVLWSTSGAYTKLLTNVMPEHFDQPPIATVQIACFRVFFAGLLLVPLLRRADLSFRPLMLGSAACFAVMNLLFVTAIAEGTAANAILLQYTAPMWMYLVSVFCLGEPADRRGTIALAIGMTGIAVIVAGGWKDDQLLTILIALGSGVTYAGVLIFLRLMRGQSSRWLTVWNHLCGAAVVMPLLIGQPVPTWQQFIVLFMFGTTQMGLAYWLVARGLRVVSPQEAGALTLLEPLLNPLWAFLVSPATETPPPATYIGGVLILGALAWRYWPRQQSGRVHAGGNRGLRRLGDRRQVAAVDDDLHYRLHVRRQLGLLAELAAQGRAKFGIGAGDGELVPAAGLGTAGRDAAGKRHDDAWGLGYGLRAALRRQEGCVEVASHEPEVAAHQAFSIAEAPVDDKLPRQDRHHPHAPAETDIANLMAVAEIRQLAAEFEPGRFVEQVETRRGRTGQHVLADADQQRALQGWDAVLAKARHMKLHNGTRSAIGRGEGRVAAGTDIAVEAGLAVAQDGARGVAGGGRDGVVEPEAIAGGDEDLRVDAAESLGVGVVDCGMVHGCVTFSVCYLGSPVMSDWAKSVSHFLCSGVSGTEQPRADPTR
jgi:DME family drug/metabolite transporter